MHRLSRLVNANFLGPDYFYHCWEKYWSSPETFTSLKEGFLLTLGDNYYLSLVY